MEGRTLGRSTDPSLDATSTIRRSLGTNTLKNRFSSCCGTSTAAVLRNARRLWSTGVVNAASPSPERLRAVTGGQCLVPPCNAMGGATDEHGLLQGNPLVRDPDSGFDPQADFRPGHVNRDVGRARKERDRQRLAPHLHHGESQRSGFAKEIPQPPAIYGLKSDDLIGIAVSVPEVRQTAKRQ